MQQSTETIRRWFDRHRQKELWIRKEEGGTWTYPACGWRMWSLCSTKMRRDTSQRRPSYSRERGPSQLLMVNSPFQGALLR